MQVLEALDTYYKQYNSNVHRGVHNLSARATDAYEAARRKVQAFVNAESWREIVFTRNATEAINLVAAAWGAHHLVEGDEVVLSVMEHHSNIVPWQVRRYGMEGAVSEWPFGVAPDTTPPASIDPLSKCVLALSPPSRALRAHGYVCSLVT